MKERFGHWAVGDARLAMRCLPENCLATISKAFKLATKVFSESATPLLSCGLEAASSRHSASAMRVQWCHSGKSRTAAAGICRQV